MSLKLFKKQNNNNKNNNNKKQKQKSMEDWGDDILNKVWMNLSATLLDA